MARVKIAMILFFTLVSSLLSAWLIYYWNIDNELFSLYKYIVLSFVLINTIFVFVLLFLKKFPVLAISWFTVCMIYLTGEAITLLTNLSGRRLPELESTWDAFLGVEGYYNSHCAKWDPYLGHRWLSGRHRMVKFNGNEEIFDNWFHANNHGRLSYHDYSYQKSDTVKRYIVFGDSFTDLQYIPYTWTDVCTKILNTRHGNYTHELYNFGSHGGGLPAWYYTFFNDIIPNYEFDGIILAVFGDNLARPHYFMHFENGYSYDGIFESPPKTDSEFRNALLSANTTRNIFPGKELDSVVNVILNRQDWKQSYFLPFNWYLFRNIYSLVNNVWSKIYWKKFEKGFIYSENSMAIDDEYLHAKYSKKKIAQLEEMINYSKAHGKEFIFVTVPDQYGLYAQLSGKEIILQTELDYLARKHNIVSYNGYSFFKDVRIEEIAELYIKKDPHWNQQGANKFALEFAKLISGDDFPSIDYNSVIPGY